MDDITKNTLEHFINDKHLSDTVYNFLLDNFLDSYGIRDIHILASERLSIDNLKDAWKELLKLRAKEINEKTKPQQIGL